MRHARAWGGESDSCHMRNMRRFFARKGSTPAGAIDRAAQHDHTPRAPRAVEGRLRTRLIFQWPPAQSFTRCSTRRCAGAPFQRRGRPACNRHCGDHRLPCTPDAAQRRFSGRHVIPCRLRLLHHPFAHERGGRPSLPAVRLPAQTREAAVAGGDLDDRSDRRARLCLRAAAYSEDARRCRAERTVL